MENVMAMKDSSLCKDNGRGEHMKPNPNKFDTKNREVAGCAYMRKPVTDKPVAPVKPETPVLEDCAKGYESFSFSKVNP